MIYGFDSRIRYSEVDLKLQLTLGSVIDYFQDCSIFHSESVGLGVEHLEKQHRAWMLSAWQIVPKRFPRLGEKVRVETWPYDFKGFYGSRNFAMTDERGERIIWANSLWIYVDTHTGRPTKIDEEQARGYVLEEKLPMDYAPRKISLPGEAEVKEGFSVVKHHLDTNHHVNNAQYVKMAEEYLPDDFSVGQIRVEYRKEARLHDLVVPRVAWEEMCCTVALSDEKGSPYAIVEFRRL